MPGHDDATNLVGAGLQNSEGRVQQRRLHHIISRILGDAAPDDVVVVAGKGHETTQTIGDEVLPFDDREVAREVLRRAGFGGDAR